MPNNFIAGLDRMSFVPVSPTTNAHAAGQGMDCDLRNDNSRYPYIFQLVSNAILNVYNVVTKSWAFAANPGLAGTFGAGAGCKYAPSRSLFGVLAAGSTSTVVKLSTVLPAAVGANMLAQKGDNLGFRIRITSLGTGKTEEKMIVGNTASNAPDITVESAFTFTPAANDIYEILSGRLLMLGAGTTASGTFRSFGVATNFLATLSNTNLPATIGTDFAAAVLDELYVPSTRKAGEGFIVGAGTYNNGALKCLTATATASGTLTGQSAAGDFGVLANEYRNFQIRIVEDTVNVTAVGQRRIIASHTGGAGVTPVYTLGTAWSVTPSANAKYVIEYPNLLILRSTATTTVYTYNYSGATINNGTNSINADAWSTTYFAAAGNAMGAGCMLFTSHGIEPDASKNARHSYVHCFRGGGALVDIFDIAGGTTGAWSNGVTIDGALAMGAGSNGCLAPCDQDGKYAYINVYVASALNQMYRYSLKSRTMMPFTSTDWIQAGTAATGHRMAAIAIFNGTEVYSDVLLISHLAQNAFEVIIMA